MGRMCLPLQACLTLCAEGGSAARLQFLMKVKGYRRQVQSGRIYQALLLRLTMKTAWLILRTG